MREKVKILQKKIKKMKKVCSLVKNKLDWKLKKLKKRIKKDW